ncbi:MAG: DUF2191 domain-containing protein [Gemmatimonadetes bacterium]|nr:DUF2191 domain-containing protein [Gemmatimonadota bacterium]MXY84231.1 DUF2191 domain-containing protein [Gemmatimonadota bacterium]MYB69358.1 DUF2191 domain-containing protein [Gemmatimonadota bacterium]
MLDQASIDSYFRIMKTTVDIPEDELEDAIRFTQAKTKREAIVGAIADFNRRMRMAELVQYAGTCPDMITPQELQAARRQG